MPKPNLYIYGTCFNVSKTCKRTIESLLRLKNYFNIKFFIVDNYSKDGSARELKRVFVKYKLKYRLIQIHSNRGGGRQHAMDMALKEGKDTDYLMYIDLDTIYTKKFIEYVKKFVFERRYNVGLCALSLKKINQKISWKNLNAAEDMERFAHFKANGYKLDKNAIANSEVYIHDAKFNSLINREKRYARNLNFIVRMLRWLIDAQRGQAFKNFNYSYDFYGNGKKYRIPIFIITYIIANLLGVYKYSNEKSNFEYIIK